MAVNSLYPGFVKLSYTGAGHNHIQIVPIASITSAGATYNLGTKDGGSIDWVAGVLEYANAIKAIISDTDDINSAQLWQIPSVGADPIFLEDSPITVAGTNPNPGTPRVQNVMTLRTVLGGLYRNYIMECAVLADTVTPAPFPVGAYLTMFNYLVGNSSIVVGRDGGALSSAVRVITKENDALRKKYFLNV